MSNTASIQQAIRFLYLQVVGVDFSNKYCGNQSLPEDLGLNFTFATSLLLDNETGQPVADKFSIKFKVVFTDKDEIFTLSFDANAIFESNTPVDDSFLASEFANLNAPAIAFPFLRAFISTFTLNAGYQPLVLPAFNFSEAIQVQPE